MKVAVAPPELVEVKVPSKKPSKPSSAPASTTCDDHPDEYVMAGLLSSTVVFTRAAVALLIERRRKRM